MQSPGAGRHDPAYPQQRSLRARSRQPPWRRRGAGRKGSRTPGGTARHRRRRSCGHARGSGSSEVRGSGMHTRRRSPCARGQIYRSLPGEFSPGEKHRESRDFVRGQALREEFEASADRVNCMSNTAALGVWTDPVPRILCGGDDGCEILAASKLIIATGAYDRPVAFPGWTLPGVMTAGGVQSLVKTMGICPGKRALVAGTGPLLLVVANQLADSGVEVAAVLEGVDCRRSNPATLPPRVPRMTEYIRG